MSYILTTNLEGDYQLRSSIRTLKEVIEDCWELINHLLEFDENDKNITLIIEFLIHKLIRNSRYHQREIIRLPEFKSFVTYIIRDIYHHIQCKCDLSDSIDINKKVSEVVDYMVYGYQ
jgi:hypothetical protein